MTLLAGQQGPQVVHVHSRVPETLLQGSLAVAFPNEEFSRFSSWDSELEETAILVLSVGFIFVPSSCFRGL